MNPRTSRQELVGERFTLVRPLGNGGFGEVWEALDHRRSQAVALKILTRAGPEALLRFKAEFRGLADLVHPNLVTLYELFGLEEAWFFTMALVRGVPFTSWVGRFEGGLPAPEGATRSSPLGSDRHPSDLEWPWEALPPAGSSPDAYAGTLEAGDGLPRARERAEPRGAGAAVRWRTDLARLRDAMVQLTLGVAALHRAGKVHRDLKPSNVLVEADGRVVVLDFGLVSDRRASRLGREPVGTPAYMAPEQVEGVAGPASDWYSVGVMLFRALTGRLPFQGSALGVLLERTQTDAPPVRSCAPSAPAELAELCDGLLRRDPGARPGAAELLGRLQGHPAAAAATLEDPTEESFRSGELGPVLAFEDDVDEVFVGRLEERQRLREALSSLTPRKPVAVFIQGGSGLGKSALLRRFLREARRADPGCVVLAGRCYEQETVPFKALDGVVDALYEHLAPLGGDVLAPLLPPDFWSVTRVFPVLRGLAGRAGVTGPAAGGDTEPPMLTRRRAALVLRALLAAIGARRRVLLALDDLQWGDEDSAWLLAELLRPPDPPPVLLLGAFRPEAPENPVTTALRALQADEEAFGAIHDLRLDPLAPAVSRELARRLLATQTAPPGVDLDALAGEARGNPFFVGELVRHADLFRGEEDLGGEAGSAARAVALPEASEAASETSLSGRRLLEGLLRARVARLEPQSRSLLELVAVASQPLPRAVLAGATQAEAAGHAALRAARLLRDVAGDRIDVYHDRVRQAVLAGLPLPRREELHGVLADALLVHRPEDAEAVAFHLQRAGRPEQAGRYAAQAADRAAEGLAFARAAALYRLAIDLERPRGAEAVRLWRGLGEARANAGQGAEAADALLMAAGLLAAEGGPEADGARLAVTRQAGEQLLRAGHLERGLQVLGPVLVALGIGPVPPPWRAIAGFLGRRAVVRLRGQRFRERPASACEERALLRIDALQGLATGLAQADPVRGAAYQAEFLLAALELGEPRRVAKALAMEVAYAASLGPSQRARCDALLQDALALADRLGEPRLRAQTLLAAGVAEYLLGRLRESLRLCREAEAIFEADPTRLAWEHANAQIYIQTCLAHSGRLREAMARHGPLVAQARDRRDRFAEVAFQTASCYLHWMARDEPDAGLRLADQMVPRETAGKGRIQQWYALNSRVTLNVYAGRGAAAWQAVEELYPGLRRSLLLRVPIVRLQTHMLRCLAANAAASERPGADRAPYHRVVAETWRSLAGDPHPIATAAHRLIGAGLAFTGLVPAPRDPALRRLRAQALLAEAEEILEGTIGMTLVASAARYQRGRLLGGARGEALCEGALAPFRAEGVVRPEAMIATLVPDPRPPEAR